MPYSTVFRRYELKYLLTERQKSLVLEAIRPYMRLDKYGRTTIRSLYFDTDNYRLIRRSIEKPIYKEKLRIRSYSEAGADSTVFVEEKKKHEGIVYKRRLPLPRDEAMAWLLGEAPCPVDTQISREIDYFTAHYGRLRPAVFLSYEREAYHETNGGDLRVTFDEDILARETDLSLGSAVYGEPLLSVGMTLMELKCTGGIPLFMTKILSREKIYKTPFSKYGTAYTRLILPRLQAEELVLT